MVYGNTSVIYHYVYMFHKEIHLLKIVNSLWSGKKFQFLYITDIAEYWAKELFESVYRFTFISQCACLKKFAYCIDFKVILHKFIVI